MNGGIRCMHSNIDRSMFNYLISKTKLLTIEKKRKPKTKINKENVYRECCERMKLSRKMLIYGSTNVRTPNTLHKTP